MHITVHKPNMQVVASEAKRIELEGGSGGSGEIKRFDIKEGTNVIRLLPPWSAKGLLFKKYFTHFRIPPERSIHTCLMTWPDKYDSCFLCETLDKVQAIYPDIDLWQQRHGIGYYANVIDRDDEASGPQIVRLTQGVYNWLILQLDNKEVGDLSDYESAFDIVITKSVTKKGTQKKTTYKCDRAVNRTPLHEEEDKVVSWLSRIYDLDRIVAPPKDEALAELKGAASRMLIHYQRQHRDGTTSMDTRSEPVQDASREPERTEDPAPPASDSEPAQALSELDPSQYPKCHASFDNPEKNESGTIGFDPSGSDCLTCAFEFACMDAKSAKGI